MDRYEVHGTAKKKPNREIKMKLRLIPLPVILEEILLDSEEEVLLDSDEEILVVSFRS